MKNLIIVAVFFIFAVYLTSSNKIQRTPVLIIPSDSNRHTEMAELSFLHYPIKTNKRIDRSFCHLIFNDRIIQTLSKLGSTDQSNFLEAHVRSDLTKYYRMIATNQNYLITDNIQGQQSTCNNYHD